MTSTHAPWPAMACHALSRTVDPICYIPHPRLRGENPVIPLGIPPPPHRPSTRTTCAIYSLTERKPSRTYLDVHYAYLVSSHTVRSSYPVMLRYTPWRTGLNTPEGRSVYNTLFPIMSHSLDYTSNDSSAADVVDLL